MSDQGGMVEGHNNSTIEDLINKVVDQRLKSNSALIYNLESKVCALEDACDEIVKRADKDVDLVVNHDANIDTLVELATANCEANTALRAYTNDLEKQIRALEVNASKKELLVTGIPAEAFRGSQNHYMTAVDRNDVVIDSRIPHPF